MGAFQLSGVIYIGWQLMLVIVSLTKLLSRSEITWEVTKRAPAAAAAQQNGADAAEKGAVVAAGANGGAPAPAPAPTSAHASSAATTAPTAAVELY